MPSEIVEFLGAVVEQLKAAGDAYGYWDACTSAREAFREKTRLGLEGKTVPLPLDEIRSFLDLAEAHLAATLDAMMDPETGLYSTYFKHEATSVEPNGEAGPSGTPVRVMAFEPRRVALSLEAPMHALRQESDVAGARAAYERTKHSPLYDAPLKMWLVADDVSAEGPEIGRIGAWPPGWFENENVFMHMQHKWLLSLLMAGLYDEFFENMQNGMCPFQDPEVYGRSPLENTSFIVSSRHPNAELHGRGFLPRSSGTTAEVVHILLMLSFGKAPFRCENGRLSLRFEPVLPDWLFTTEEAEREIVSLDGSQEIVAFPPNSYSALFLGHVLVTYVNPARKPTFGPEGVTLQNGRLVYNDGREWPFEGPALDEPHALAVRNREVRRILFTLA